MGSPGKIQFLKDVTRSEKPSFIFLSETISSYKKMENLCSKLNFEGFIAVEPQGKSGGVAMFWKDAEKVKLLSLSRNHIDISIHMNDNREWHLTGIYGEPSRTQRSKTWDLLRNLSRDANLPWCLVGDFNNVTSQADIKGGVAYPSRLIEGFNDCLTDVELHDHDIIGHQYTWERGRNTDHWIEIRLDRVLSNMQWSNMFEMVKVYNLEGSPSDHSPLLLIPEQQSRGNKRKQFRFENAWLTEPVCFQIIKDCWEEEGNRNVNQKVRRCADSLEVWGREITGCFGKRIKECKIKLKDLRQKRDPQSITEYESTKKKLHLILDQKEIFWRQRSKQLWLQAGDKNTKYFHASCSKRKRNNHIQRLKSEEGEWTDWNGGLAEMIRNYFQQLFTEGNTHTEEVLRCIPKLVSDQHNSDLLSPISDEEVKDALFHMHPDKAPGPDGMTPAFFQKNWSTLGNDIIHLTRNFFMTGVIGDNMNATNIVLIPKKKHPTFLTELRPIALCNVVMKVVTKVIANRLKKVLETVISDTQSAFLPGRLISDNVMISFEIMHYLKRKKFGKEGFMALKLDMSKAYDRIEWKFLKEILLTMGFSNWWMYLILQCVTTVEYNIVHGEYTIGPIIPTRGLRQGDPLSPYLFIVCAEGLSCLLRYYEEKKWLHGVRICKKAPVINHILFADDCYIYCKANHEEATKVVELLKTYEMASGRNKSVIFGYLKDKVKASIQSWNEKKISRPAKEILIKMVAQTLPSYAMNVFLLPVDLTKDIENCMAKFFWNSSQNSNSKIGWMSWERMTKHKYSGGLGFRCLRDSNIAMLGKQCWRLITNQESLVAQVYKAKYYPDRDFMEAKIESSPSFIWRSICEARKVISVGSSWRIGNGVDIQVLNQPWLNDRDNPYVVTDSPALVNQNMASLFSMNTKDWDLDILDDIFVDRDRQAIMNTVVEQDLDKDILVWNMEHTGQYTVKSAYRILQNQREVWNEGNHMEFWKTVWSIKAPPQVMNLIWRASMYCLPTLVQLQTKHVQVNNVYPVCKEEAETIIHALAQCKSASACWKIFKQDISTEGDWDFMDWLNHVLAGQSSDSKAKILTLCWLIWRSRNDLIWNGKRWPILRIVAKAWEYLSQWRAAQNRGFSVPINPTVEGDGATIWVKPQHNEVKITVDAAIFQDKGSSGFGIIARDHDGWLILARSLTTPEVLNPTLAEAIAIKEALSWTMERGWSSVTIESDCLAAIQLIRSTTPMRSRLGKVIEDCRELSRFNNIRLSFIKRSANMPAHELAHVSHMYPDRIFDWRSVPIKVKDCISYDLIL
ncbi:hypothetical protein AgCh_016796 [Apium graveolens]